MTVDLSRMARVLDLDGVAGRVSCEAGITGPALEVALRDAGFALGHHPASFERSTVGGWLATGAVGQDATGTGPIADSVRSLALVAGTGLVETGSAPGASEGPDLLDLLIGSEGAFGVIARATLALRPRPAAQAGAALLFGSFADGLAALRRLAQAGAAPSFVRLCDAAETRLALCDAPDERRARRARAREGALLLLVETGAAGPTGARVREAVEACAPESPAELGQAVARRAIEARYHEPYVRDALVEAGVIVDRRHVGVLERAAGPARGDRLGADWRARRTLARGLPGPARLPRRRLPRGHLPRARRRRRGDRGLAACTHGRAGRDPRRRRGDLAPLRHRHAPRALAGARAGPRREAVLRSVKEEFDPLGLMNPGKLLPDDEPRFLSRADGPRGEHVARPVPARHDLGNAVDEGDRGEDQGEPARGRPDRDCDGHGCRSRALREDPSAASSGPPGPSRPITGLSTRVIAHAAMPAPRANAAGRSQRGRRRPVTPSPTTSTTSAACIA